MFCRPNFFPKMCTQNIEREPPHFFFSPTPKKYFSGLRNNTMLKRKRKRPNYLQCSGFSSFLFVSFCSNTFLLRFPYQFFNTYFFFLQVWKRQFIKISEIYRWGGVLRSLWTIFKRAYFSGDNFIDQSFSIYFTTWPRKKYFLSSISSHSVSILIIFYQFQLCWTHWKGSILKPHKQFVDWIE